MNPIKAFKKWLVGIPDPTSTPPMPKAYDKGRFYSETSKKIEYTVLGGGYYSITAYIMDNETGKIVDRVSAVFEDLDKHERAMNTLSQEAYKAIIKQYQLQAIIAKLYDLDIVNNKLEMFAKSQLGSLYEPSQN